MASSFINTFHRAWRREFRFDWPHSALASSPLVEGDRLWFCNNRFEVICLDIGPLHRGEGGARRLWQLDMMKEFGIKPRGMHIGSNAIHCSIASYKDFIYINTANAKYLDRVPAPEAPSLICLQKHAGTLLWKDNSPGDGILEVQHGSPLVIEVNGQGQVIMGQGDGWQAGSPSVSWRHADRSVLIDDCT